METATPSTSDFFEEDPAGLMQWFNERCNYKSDSNLDDLNLEPLGADPDFLERQGDLLPDRGSTSSMSVMRHRAHDVNTYLSKVMTCAHNKSP